MLFDFLARIVQPYFRARLGTRVFLGLSSLTLSMYDQINLSDSTSHILISKATIKLVREPSHILKV